jgi:hypothetical protein
MPFKPHPTDPTKVIYKTSEYWIPKPWQGLTDDEVDLILWQGVFDAKDVRAIETKLKEKNGG